MTRDRLLLTVELVAGAFGVAAVLGILHALVLGADYPAFVVPAACIYLVFHPLPKLIGFLIGVYKDGLNLAKSWGDMTEDRVNSLIDRMSARKRAEFGGHIDAERKLSAIRLLREAAGIGLRDAKNAVEWMLAHRRAT